MDENDDIGTDSLETVEPIGKRVLICKTKARKKPKAVFACPTI